MLQHASRLPRGRFQAGCLAAALLLPLLAGCEEEKISAYDSPPDPPLPHWANDDVPRRRMLAAIVPRPQSVWFFKLVGPDAEVTAEASNFEQFVSSLRFSPEAKPAWTLPKGWSAQGPSENRFATIQIGAADPKLELTVTMLGGAGGDILANVHRWRQQLGYTGEELAPDELQHFVFDRTLPCGMAHVVDMVSRPLRTAAAPETSPPRAPAKSSLVDYQLPAGWQRSERAVDMAVVSLTTGSGESSARVTISPLMGAAGGVPANVNRWRTQVGLQRVDPEEIKKQAREIFVDGKPAQYFRVDGPAGDAGQGGGTILGVILSSDRVSWFVKLTGPTEVAKAEEAAFLKFAESIRIGDQGLAPKGNR